MPRFHKIKSSSVTALLGLIETDASFDIAYVDGSHLRDDVMIDSLLSWKVLRPGGVLIWDDYGGGAGKPERERVFPAIDTFLSWYQGEYVVLHRGYQIIIQRKAE